MHEPTSKPIILVIELDYHVDILGFFLASTDKDMFEVHCICPPNLLKDIPGEHREGVQFHEVTGNSQILGEMKKIGADLVFFNTCASRYRFWSKNCPDNAVVRIHNINFSFIPKRSIRIGFNFFELRKAFTYIVWRQIFHLDWIFLVRFLKKVRTYSFLSEVNKRYFESVRPDLAKKSGPVFSSAAYNPQFLKTENHAPLKIVIPGTLEEKRKDFGSIRRAADVFSRSNVPIELYFAGKVPSAYQSFIQELKAKQNEHFKIITFEGFMPQADFDLLLKSSDLLFLPTVPFTRYKIFREVYGKSKISGGVNDFIKFGKYTILPEHLELDDALLPLSFRYGSTEQNMREIIESAMDACLNRRADYDLKIMEHAKHYSAKNVFIRQNESLKKLTDLHAKN